MSVPATFRSSVRTVGTCLFGTTSVWPAVAGATGKSDHGGRLVDDSRLPLMRDYLAGVAAADHTTFISIHNIVVCEQPD